MIRAPVVVVVAVLAATALASGCGSGNDADLQHPSPPDMVVPALPATTQELGVVQWKLTKDSNQEAFATTGYDAQDNVRSQIVHWTKRDASGNVEEGGSASTVQGPAYLHYTKKDGQQVIDWNDFQASPDAARALDLTMADLEAFAAAHTSAWGAVNTASVRPLSGPPGDGLAGLPQELVTDPCKKPIVSAGETWTCQSLVEDFITKQSLYDEACPPDFPPNCFCPGVTCSRPKPPRPDLHVDCDQLSRDITLSDAALQRAQGENSCAGCYPIRKVEPPSQPNCPRHT
jgi:hypothetical protein